MIVIKFYYVDAFADQLFGGNPAAVCLLPSWLPEKDLHAIHAKQISERGGELFCQIQGDRVLIGGHAVLYTSGTLMLDIKK